MNSVKTLEEHIAFAEQFARVSFYFARKWLTVQCPGIPVSQLIKDRTPLLYHILELPMEAWDTDPAGLAILARADLLSHLSPEEFEEELLSFAAPFIREAAVRTYPNVIGVTAPAFWNCCSLKYDPPKAELPADWVVFHINNSIGPKSIFDVPDYLPHCFLLLMKEAEIRFGSNTLYTSTWLNGREDFLQYFPQEWRDNLTPSIPIPQIPQWHFGFWGQLITGKGTINPKTEAFLRENGTMKYPCYSSHCSFENMRRHLKENFL